MNVRHSPRLSDRHPQRDPFARNIIDVASNGDITSMQHPILSLSSKPRRCERGESSPSRCGMAIVHDRDVLLYCIGRCAPALKEGRPSSRRMRFTACDLQVATNRQGAFHASCVL